jgi:glycosyltransferase involved in cell wall biosynthesis
VTWQGQRADLSELLPHASVAVLPSRDDPMPLAALEAMACAVPLVVARVGGLTDVTAGGCAVQIPRDDADALAQGIARVLSDSGFAQQLGAAAVARVRERFTPEQHMARLEQHLAAVAARRRR